MSRSEWGPLGYHLAIQRILTLASGNPTLTPWLYNGFAHCLFLWVRLTSMIWPAYLLSFCGLLPIGYCTGNKTGMQSLLRWMKSERQQVGLWPTNDWQVMNLRKHGMA